MIPKRTDDVIVPTSPGDRSMTRTEVNEIQSPNANSRDRLTHERFPTNDTMTLVTVLDTPMREAAQKARCLGIPVWMARLTECCRYPVISIIWTHITPTNRA